MKTNALIIMLLCAFIIACENEEEIIPTIDGTPVVRGIPEGGINAGDLSAQTTNVATYEMVFLNVEDSLLQESYTGTFGGIEVQLVRASGTVLYTFVPPFPQEGQYALVSPLGDILYEVTVFDSAPAIEELENSFSDPLNGLSFVDDALLRDSLTQENEEITRLYEGLSEEDKIKVASYFKKTREYMSFFDAFMNDTYAGFSGRKSSLFPNCQNMISWEKYWCMIDPLRYGMGQYVEAASYMFPTSFNISNSPTIIRIARYFGVQKSSEWIQMLHQDARNFMELAWIPSKEGFREFPRTFQSGNTIELKEWFILRNMNGEDLLDTDGEFSEFIKLYETFISLQSALPRGTVIDHSYRGYINGVPILRGTSPKEEKVTLHEYLDEFEANIIRASPTPVGSYDSIKVSSYDNQGIMFNLKYQEERTVELALRVEKNGFEVRDTIEVKVTGGTNIYDIEIGEVINGEITNARSVRSGEEITVPNYMRPPIRFTIDGVPIPTDDNPDGWFFDTFPFGKKPTSLEDIVDKNYPLRIWNRNIGNYTELKANLRLSNRAFRILTSSVWVTQGWIYGELQPGILLKFHEDGTHEYEQDLGNGTFHREGLEYSFSELPTYYEHICSEGRTLKYNVIGSFSLVSFLRNTYAPLSFLILSDGTLKPWGVQGCQSNDRYYEIETWDCRTKYTLICDS